jgi:hypothetical protein
MFTIIDKEKTVIISTRSTREIYNNIIKNIKEKKCKAVIKTGKNKNKICNRQNCMIKGHDKYIIVDSIGKCKANINRGKNKICGRIKCKVHRCVKTANIATYLKLPKVFEDIVNNSRHFFYDKYIDDITKNKLKKYNYNLDRNLIIEDIYDFMNSTHLEEEKAQKISILMLKYLLTRYENIGNWRKNLQILYFLIIYKILDTTQGRKLLMENEKFCSTVKNKFTDVKNQIIELSLSNQLTKDISNYFLKNFTCDKIFFEKHRNDIVDKIKICCEKLILKKYHEILETRYAPGGKGFLEAEKEFNLYRMSYKIC